MPLVDFGFGSLGLTEADFVEPGTVIQLGYEPLRVDLITSIPPFSFEAVWQGRVYAPYGETTVPFIGKQELIAAKHATGRPQDLADLQLLEGDAGG